MTPEPSDGELLEQLRAGAPQAFDALYRRESPRIWAFLCRLSGSAEAAQDAFQETWLAAARHAGALRTDTQLVPWLLTIARNKHRNRLRLLSYDAGRRRAAADVPPPGASPPDEVVDARIRFERMEAALGRLPEAYREVLLLHGVEGLDSPTMARVLGLSDAAVRKRLSRARAALEELIR